MGVWVTPELRFDAVLRQADSKPTSRTPVEWWRLASAAGRLRNIGLDSEHAIDAISALGSECSAAAVVLALIEAHVENATPFSPKVVVVKSGAHAFVWRGIQRCLPDARFVHLVRDPRAVVSSKLRTVRPYFPDERMAWGGVGLAAIRWCMYQRAMREAEAITSKVMEIRYEEFLGTPEGSLERLARFLGAEVNPAARGRYTVPQAERIVHPLLEDGRLRADRVDGWRTEIDPGDQRVVEAICFGEMRRKGYGPDRSWTPLQRAFVAGSAAPGTGMRMLAHFVRVVRRRLDDRFTPRDYRDPQRP